MARDRYLNSVLTVIAVLLALNLMRSTGTPVSSLVESPAQAQSYPVYTPPVQDRPASNLRVAAIGGFNIAQLKDVVSLGDGKSFVVSNPGGFLVYQVESNQVRTNSN